MKRRKKYAGNRRGVQLVTLCISTAMVLVLLGLVVFSVQTSRNLSQWVKENLTVTVMLSDDVSVNGCVATFIIVLTQGILTILVRSRH